MPNDDNIPDEGKQRPPPTRRSQQPDKYMTDYVLSRKAIGWLNGNNSPFKTRFLGNTLSAQGISRTLFANELTDILSFYDRIYTSNATHSRTESLDFVARVLNSKIFADELRFVYLNPCKGRVVVQSNPQPSDRERAALQIKIAELFESFFLCQHLVTARCSPKSMHSGNR